jgi:hypothetical protein
MEMKFAIRSFVLLLCCSAALLLCCSAALLLCCSGCGPLNPYVRASNHMLHHDAVTFCWAPVGTPNEERSCRREEAARASLADCVEQTRSHVTLRTTEHIADKDLAACMNANGWQRLWIGGAVLWGEDL